ncbi:predicted protein [Histoplasma capsulatum var. duboisii H88]|uniref:Predicted protein n=1 Tax=Ajellomyces capsulatus (strain H88) TaxID=544711 RepID=F0UH96_AJEC8|nr:predicted protein [Histoplasma capsulatum var. duboisii H88]
MKHKSSLLHLANLVASHMNRTGRIAASSGIKRHPSGSEQGETKYHARRSRMRISIVWFPAPVQLEIRRFPVKVALPLSTKVQGLLTSAEEHNRTTITYSSYS